MVKVWTLLSFTCWDLHNFQVWIWNEYKEVKNVTIFVTKIANIHTNQILGEMTQKVFASKSNILYSNCVMTMDFEGIT